jgi:hypothetical protein
MNLRLDTSNHSDINPAGNPRSDDNNNNNNLEEVTICSRITMLSLNPSATKEKERVWY